MPRGVALELPSFLRSLANVIGRRADDPELVDFVTGRLGKKVPDRIGSTTKHVCAPKLGVELLFNRDVIHDDFPPIAKGRGSFVPYLSGSFLEEKLPEPLPLGIERDMSADALRERLGAPAVENEHTARWDLPVVPERDVVLAVWAGDGAMLRVNEARALSAHGHPARAVVALFLGWAASRGLLDETRVASHADLLARVVRREAVAGALLDAAMPRGLWDDRLRDLPELRDFAFGYFHNIGRRGFIRDDLVSVFGARPGPHGHAEAVLDDDSWPNVDRAAPILDERFAPWLGQIRR
jgi:hypothetical protein